MARIDPARALSVSAAIAAVVAALAVARVETKTRSLRTPVAGAFSLDAPPAPPFPAGVPRALGGGPIAGDDVDVGPLPGPRAPLDPGSPAAATPPSSTSSASVSVSPAASSSAPAAAVPSASAPATASPDGGTGADAALRADAANAVTITAGGPQFPVIPPATMLVTLGGSSPDGAWSAVSSAVRAGDRIVAHVGGDASLASEAWLGFGDRIHADRPLVGFVLAVDDPARLETMAAQGLPASASAVGFGTPDGWDAPTLAAVSTAIRAAGKQMFATASTTRGATFAVGLGEIGARADLIELRAQSGDPTALALEIAPAVRALRQTASPMIYVRLPAALAGSTDDVSAATGALAAQVAGVGVALPESTPSTVVEALRAGGD